MATALQLHKTKQVKFGLEVPNGLTYKGWEPGGEYTKPFILKNVNLKTQKIKYKISSDQFSSAVYPQPIVLSAGTSYTLPITFRPSAKCPYEEFILIETGEGEFKIPIQAQLPKADISLPHFLKFGMTAVLDSLTVNFELSNIGNVLTDYSWEVPKGFRISPPSGSLPPKQSTRLTATFSPTTASVYSDKAVCTFSGSPLRESVCKDQGRSPERLIGGGKETKVVQLEGIGKYPHVTVMLTTGTSKLPLTSTKKRGSKLKGSSARKLAPEIGVPSTDAPTQLVESGGVSGVRGVREVTVDFGNVPVETVAEKWIEIFNVSPVSLNFDLTPVSTARPDFTPHFTCSEFEGSLQPQESKKIKLLFSPSLPSPHPLTGSFTVRAVGGLSSSTVMCTGTPVGPKVTIEERVVNFGSVEMGKSVKKTVHIKNESTAGTTFQFQLGSDSVFQLSPHSGELGPGSSQTLIAHFTPTKPIPHCRHLTLLLKHQDPLCLSLIGTCYSETVRPVSIQSRQLDSYLQNAKTGLSKLAPEQLKSYLDDGQLSLDDESGMLVPSSTLSLPTPGTPLTPHTSTCAHYLWSQNEPSTLPHVSADVEVLKFGYCAPQRTSDGQHVSVTNHTDGTVNCVWMSRATDSFSVRPEERFIQPGTTACFTVNFSPDTASQFYFKEIECFVFYKGLQDYRHIDQHTITPPWCLTVQASGHSFTPGTETFLPRLKIDSKNLVFPATVPGQPVYRTALLTNEGNTPILFNFQQDQTNTFSVKPSHGLIHDSQLLVLQLLPTESRVYKHVLTCQLNAAQLWDENLLLSGSGEAPMIQLDNEGELYFKPTCVGASSSLMYSVSNTSRLPVNFCWKFDVSEECVVRVEPRSGTILPNQSQKHTWYFAPTKCQDYSLKTVLHCTIQTSVLGENVAPQARSKSVVNIHGLGTQGTIKCSPESVDCGTIIIGTSSHHRFTLSNPSACSLYYRLTTHCSTSRPLLSPTKQNIVEVSPVEGVLPASTQEPVTLTVRPATTEQYTCTVRYQLTGETSHTAKSMQTFDLCTLTVKGAYPSLEIVDIQGMGVANTHSKASLWNMLNIDKVNLGLRDEPSVAELRYAIATRHSMRRRVPVRTRAIVDFDFGAAPLNAGSSVVHIMLENKGHVQTEWAFQFPSDMHLEPEYWAESGQLDDVEKHELNIVDNELFTVEPKRGCLQPGQITTVIASFKHTHIGASKLPVLLKINRGREILLNWTGVTVELGEASIHFTSLSHKFYPVSIGLQAYPRQVYTLHNVGDSPVNYEVGTGPLETLTHNNYNMPILECLQPRGLVPGLSSVPVEFVFSPIEAKKYVITLPIHFSTGDSVFVSFSGEGLDMNQPLPSWAQIGNRPPQNIPVYSSISIPGQLANLSQQTVSFGHLPLFSAERRLVFVSNHSPHTLSYQWELGSKLAKEVLSVQPMTGYIQPGECAACKVTFCSHSSPSFYSLDLLCQVVNESEMLIYQSELREWERRKKEKKHLFTITDTTHSPASKSTKRPHSMSKLKSLPGGQTKKKTIKKSTRPVSSDNELRGKLSALPPIGVTEETYDEWKKKDMSVKSKARPHAKGTPDNEPPTPPEPLTLHLGVSAQTFSIPDYSTQESDLDKFHIDRQTVVSSGWREGGEPVRVGVEEEQTLQNLLLQMIRELLDDANFHTAIKHITEEPVPYFAQFSSRDELSESVKQSARRHIYASGLASMPSGHDLSPHPSHMHASHTPSQTSLSQDMDEACEVGVGSPLSQPGDLLETEDESGTEHKSQERIDMQLDSKIKQCSEFTNLVEGILENTVLNILKEASSGEMNITTPIYTIAKAPELNL